MAEQEWTVFETISTPDHAELWRKVGSRPIYAESSDAALLVAARQCDLHQGRYLVMPTDAWELRELVAHQEFSVV